MDENHELLLSYWDGLKGALHDELSSREIKKFIGGRTDSHNLKVLEDAVSMSWYVSGRFENIAEFSGRLCEIVNWMEMSNNQDLKNAQKSSEDFSEEHKFLSALYQIGYSAGKLISTAKYEQDKADALKLSRGYSSIITHSMGYSKQDIIKRAKMSSLWFVDCVIGNCEGYSWHGKTVRGMKERENLSQLAEYAGYLKVAIASTILKDGLIRDNSIDFPSINQNLLYARDMFNIAGSVGGIRECNNLMQRVSFHIINMNYEALTSTEANLRVGSGYGKGSKPCITSN